MDRDAVKCWMSCIHGQYEKRFMKYFGTTLAGFFFDEPYANREQIYQDNGITMPTRPWTKNLFKAFKKKYGYGLKNNLYRLYSEEGDYRTVRVHYWKLIADLFSVNFSRQVADWCGKHNILSTGHCIWEEKFLGQIIANGDIHEVLKHMQVPGMDMLSGWLNDSYLRKSLNITAKLVSSTARYSGAERTMCEAFGVRNWNASIAGQKKDNDWLAAMGINLINDNTFTYSISGFRKRSVSGKHFTQPWWKYYRIFSDYCRRVSLFAATGTLDAETAVLYPKTSAMSTVNREINGSYETAHMQEVFIGTLDALAKSHIDYELLFEDILKESKADKGILKCPNAKFRVIVIPCAYGLDAECAEILDAFSRSGGTVIFAGNIPEWTVADNKRALLPLQLEKASSVPFKKRNEREFSLQLAGKILKHVTPKWSISGAGSEQVTATARKDKNGYLIFLANGTDEEKKFTLSHNLAGTTEIMDVDTGKIYAVPVKRKGMEILVDITLAREQSFIVSVPGTKTAGAKPVTSMPAWKNKFNRIVRMDEEWDFSVRPENHYLPALFFRLDPLAEGFIKRWHEQPMDGAWQKIVEEEIPMCFTQKESPYYWVRGEFNLGFIPRDLKLIADNKRWDMLVVNGKQAEKPGKFVLWDGENAGFDIAALCKKGKNNFALRVKTSPWQGYDLPYFRHQYFIDPVVISGNFAVNGKKILTRPKGRIKTGSWTEQGYPYFAGTGIYRQKIHMEEVTGISRLVVEDAFTVVESEANGISLGARAWHPYVFDTGEALKKGENEITISVTNSLGNILKRQYQGKYGKSSQGGILKGVYFGFG